MDRELAKIVAITAFRSSADINNLIPLLKEHCSADEYRLFGLAIAASSAEISQQILYKIFSMHPDLESEFDNKIKKYGRPF